MSEPVIKSATQGAVATIALARPDRLNALTRQVFDDLQAALDAAIADGARALVLTGEGRAFCSGADLRPDAEQGREADFDLGDEIEAYYNPLTRRLIDLPIPLVTAINGPAVGAGLSIALAGDVSVAAQSAYFQLGFVNIGLVPDAGATWFVAKAVGRARAMGMALLGEQVSAEDAFAIGLVNRVVPDGDTLAEAQSIAARLAAGPAVAIERIRKQVNFAVDADLDEVLARERDNQRACGHSDDFREAIAAFAQKRAPNFKGR